MSYNMSLFMNRSIQTFLPKSFKYILNRTKHYVTFRQLNYVKNLRSKYGQSVIPILSVSFTHQLRNSLCAKVFYSSNTGSGKPMNLESLVHYENVSEETMQSLCDRFEDVLQNSSFEDWDVNYSNGVLTAILDKNHVYVINKQTPNRQIWLSSPFSGPKRYDYLDGMWIYKHDGVSLHKLLSNELTQLLLKEADFLSCTYGS